MYLYFTFRMDINNVIFLLNHYLQLNPKFYIIYTNTRLHFSGQKLYIYFLKKDIIIFFTFPVFFKSISLIEKSNNILK